MTEHEGGATAAGAGSDGAAADGPLADPPTGRPADSPRKRRRGGAKHRGKRDASLPPWHADTKREPFRDGAAQSQHQGQDPAPVRERPRRPVMQAQRAPDYLVVGHICADLLPDGRAVLGGTALYSALTAAALGLRVGVLTRGRYGTDIDGIQVPGLDQYADQLSIIVQDAEGPTVFVNEYSGGRRTQMVRRWAGEIDLRGLPPHWLNARIVHLGPIAQEIDQRQTGALQPEFLGCTPQGWMREWPSGGGRVRHVPLRLAPELLSRLDAVVVSDEEIAQAREIVEWVGQRRLGVVTLGESGARVTYGGEKTEFGGFPIKTVDLTGAGDVFAAAFFTKAAERHDSAVDAARFANATAALSLRGVGASSVPSLADVEALLATDGDLARRR